MWGGFRLLRHECIYIKNLICLQDLHPHSLEGLGTGSNPLPSRERGLDTLTQVRDWNYCNGVRRMARRGEPVAGSGGDGASDGPEAGAFEDGFGSEEDVVVAGALVTGAGVGFDGGCAVIEGVLGSGAS